MRSPRIFGQCTILVQTDDYRISGSEPCALYVAGPYITGWALVLEFIFTLAMALNATRFSPADYLPLKASLWA